MIDGQICFHRKEVFNVYDQWPVTGHHTNHYPLSPLWYSYDMMCIGMKCFILAIVYLSKYILIVHLKLLNSWSLVYHIIAYHYHYMRPLCSTTIICHQCDLVWYGMVWYDMMDRYFVISWSSAEDIITSWWSIHICSFNWLSHQTNRNIHWYTSTHIHSTLSSTSESHGVKFM